MSVNPTGLDVFLFAVLPYVAVVLFVVVALYRYLAGPFTYSSLSSQFLENKEHFWGLVPFHYGIMVVLAGHVVAFLVPAQLLWWNSRPLRLYILEAGALAFGLMALAGLACAIYRRISVPRVRVVTSTTDWILVGLLGTQMFAGVYIAVFHRWGSSWFAAALSPYLWSLVKLQPDVSYVAPLPWAVKVHILGATVLVGLFPFTRLVHVLAAPISYLWRKPQVVRWNRNRRLTTEF
jgi:nitrate reductase gamma subunit